MDNHKPQIVALGGGGFSMEPENPSLDLYVLALARNSNPAVSFLGTATGDADSYLVKFDAPPTWWTPGTRARILWKSRGS